MLLARPLPPHLQLLLTHVSSSPFLSLSYCSAAEALRELVKPKLPCLYSPTTPIARMGSFDSAGPGFLPATGQQSLKLGSNPPPPARPFPLQSSHPLSPARCAVAAPAPSSDRAKVPFPARAAEMPWMPRCEMSRSLPPSAWSGECARSAPS